MNPLSNIINGAAIITYRGKSYYTGEAGVKFALGLDAYEQDVAGFGSFARKKTTTFTASFDPRCSLAAALALYGDLQGRTLGQFLVGLHQVGSVNTTTDRLTITSHGIADATPVKVTSTTTMPSGLSATTLYYTYAVDANTLTLHTNATDAAAGTNKVDITGAGSGTINLQEEWPMVIQQINSPCSRLTIHNAQVIKFPEWQGQIDAKSPVGSVQVAACIREGFAPTDAAAYYTLDTGSAISAFDPSTIAAGAAYTVAWGGSAPWSSLSFKGGIAFKPEITLDEVIDSGTGALRGYRITKAKCTAQAMPFGVSASDLLAQLPLQSSGAGSGVLLSGNNLNISATGIYLRLVGANLRNGPMVRNDKDELIETLEWTAQVTSGTGALTDLFYIGTSAPA
jgi:hypothetical protein